MLKRDYAVIDDYLEFEQSYIPPVTRILNKVEDVVFHFFALLPRFRLGFLTMFIIWFITTFQFGRLLSENSIDYGWNYAANNVANGVFHLISQFPSFSSRSWLPYVLAMVFSVGFLVSLILAYVTNIAWKWRVPLTIVRHLIVWITTVFFFPITIALLRMVMGCWRHNSGHPHPFYDQVCWSSTNTIYMIVSTVIFLLYFATTYVCLTCLYDSAIPLNPNTLYKHMSARTTNTPEVATMLIKTFLIGIHVFGHSNDWKYPLSALIMICGVIMTTYNILYLPFYTDATQVGYIFQGMFVFWTGLVLFLQVYMNDTQGLSLLYFLGIPLILGFCILLLNARYERVVSFTDKELTSSSDVGVLMKGLIRNFLGSYSIFHPLYIDQGDAFSMKKEEMLRAVQNALQLGVSRFPSEAKLRTILGNFLAHVIQNRVLAYGELDASEKLHPDLATRFQNRDLRLYLDEEIAKNLNKEIKAFMEFKAYKESADTHMLAASKSMVSFWSELLSKHPSIDVLAEQAQVSYGALQTSLHYYDKLLKINSHSIPVLRTYGRILLDILHDPAEAAIVLDRAARIERENALKVHNSVDGDANARLNTLLRIVDEKIDIFDERNGVVMMTIGAEKRGIMESCNSTWAKMFGYRAPSDLVGKNVNVLQPDPISRHHNAILSAYLERRTSALLGKSIILLAKHQLGHIFPVDVYVRWSDEAKGKMVGVIRTLPCDHDVYLVLDGETKMVSYASLSLYSQLGVVKRDVFARKVDLGTFLPCMRVIVNDEIDNTNIVEDNWRQMCTMKGFECEGAHVITNRRVNVHAWITSVPIYDDLCIMVKMTITQINDSRGNNFDSDSDDELQGHQSYVNRFDEADLGLDVVALTSDSHDIPLYNSSSTSASARLSNPALSNPGSSPFTSPPSEPFPSHMHDNNASILSHGRSPFYHASGRSEEDAKLSNGFSAHGDPFSARSLALSDKSTVNRSNSRFKGPEYISDTASVSSSTRYGVLPPETFHKMSLGHDSFSLRNQLTGISSRTALSVGQVSVHVGLGSPMTQVAARPGRLSALPDEDNKTPSIAAPLLAGPTSSLMSSTAGRGNDTPSARDTVTELTTKPLISAEDEGRKRSRNMGKRLRMVLAIQHRIVSKRMFVMNIATFVALLMLLALSLALHFLTSEAFNYNNLAADTAYYSSMRHYTLTDSLVHVQSYYLMQEYPDTAPLFYREDVHADSTFQSITNGVLNRVLMSLDLMYDYSLKADFAAIKHKNWFASQNRGSFLAVSDGNGYFVKYPETYKGLMSTYSSQVRAAASNNFRGQFFVIKNGMDGIHSATKEVTKMVTESVYDVNRDLDRSIILLFVFSLVTILLVMPLVVLPTVISTENEKSEVVSMLRQIPRNTRRTLRKQVHDVYQFLQNNEDALEHVSKDDDDDALSRVSGKDDEDEEEEQQQQATHQKHNYGYAQNTLTAYERYMTRSTMMSQRLQSSQLEDEWDPPSMSRQVSAAYPGSNGSFNAGNNAYPGSPVSASRANAGRSGRGKGVGESQSGVLTKALEQVGSMIMSARALVPDARALSRSKQLQAQKSGRKGAQGSALFGNDHEDGHVVDLAVLSHAVRRVAEDDTNKLLIGNGGRVVEANENEEEVQVSKCRKITSYILQSSLLRSMSFKFFFFMVLMIIYFTVLYVETTTTLHHSEYATLALRYASYRLPALHIALMYARMNILFDHLFLRELRPMDAFLDADNWTLAGMKELQSVSPLNTALLFGNAELGLPVRVAEKSIDHMLYKDSCQLKDAPFYPVFSPPIFAPHFFAKCPEVELGIFRNGGHTVMSTIAENLSILLSSTAYGLFKDYINPTEPWNPQLAGVRALIQKTYRATDRLLNDYLTQIAVWEVDLYYNNLKDQLSSIETLRVVFLILFIISIFVMYFAIFKPIWSTLQSSLSQSRAMLNLVPTHMIEHMPKMVVFMTETLAKE